MIFHELRLGGSYLIDLDKKEDSRGFLARSFCREEFTKLGLATNWAQMNISLTRDKGTLRGLHFQRPPKAEVKMVRTLRGAIFDVIVDIRANSSNLW